MKVSFPYMGCVTGYKKMIELLGHEVIPAKKPSKRTVDLGVLHSPEFICYPFKVMTGTYIEACEDGAEIIVSSGGDGPCRAGLYGEIHKRILKQLGYNTEIIIFDSIFKTFKDFMRKLFLIKNKTPMYKIAHMLLLCFKMIRQMDNMEKTINIKRAYEINKDDFNKAFEKIKRMYEQCYNLKQLKKTKIEAWKMLDSIPIRHVEEKDRIKIGIVGEIYVVMESTTNMNIEQRLNDMGAEVYNIQYISDFLMHHMIPRVFNRSHSWKVFDKGKEYKRFNCGGHDMENTGYLIDFAEKGYDGAVHLLPFGCLPELVTRSIIPKLSEDYDIPILSMSLDEQTGLANAQTRVEAFYELCESKKRSKQEIFKLQNEDLIINKEEVAVKI